MADVVRAKDSDRVCGKLALGMEGVSAGFISGVGCVGSYILDDKGLGWACEWLCK
jgi:hypothetical protein